MAALSYKYGTSASKLALYALAAAIGAIICYVIVNLEPAKGLLGQPLARDWRENILWLAIPCLICLAIFHAYLLARRFAAPSFIVVHDSAIFIPKASWNSHSRTLDFDQIVKVVGPRRNKIELRTDGDSLYIEASKLRSTGEFVELCQCIFDRCRIKRNLTDDLKAPPRYFEISRSFTIGRLSSYYGAVILSSDAMFFVQLKNIDRRYKAITEGISKAIESVGGKQIAEVKISDLSDSILDHPDWPIWDREGTVRVLPRSAVTSVQLPWWGALSIRAGERRFSSSIPFWKSLQVRRQLRDSGWVSRGKGPSWQK